MFRVMISVRGDPGSQIPCYATARRYLHFRISQLSTAVHTVCCYRHSGPINLFGFKNGASAVRADIAWSPCCFC